MSDIRNQLDRAAGPDEPAIDLVALRHRVRTRHQRRRRAALAGFGAVMVLGIGATAWVSTGGDQALTTGQAPGGGSSTSAPPEETTVSTEATTSTTDTEPTTTTTTSATSPSTTEPAPTTAPATTSTAPGTVPPIVTTVPPATSRRLAGTHRGIGLPYEPTAGACAMFAHRLDGTFTLDDGEDWTYHADYCGLVDSDFLWTGAGTFAFTTPAGDELTGTFTSRAVLPSVGEPYDLTITDGTGAWSEATGTCHLTNHIRVLASGMQEQAGDFTCDVELPPAASAGTEATDSSV